MTVPPSDVSYWQRVKDYARQLGGDGCSGPTLQIHRSCCDEHDILHHRPTNSLFDILGAAGADSLPQWSDVGPPQSPDRTWLAPLDPASFGSPTQPVGPPPSGPTLAQLAEKLDALTALVEGLPLLAHNSRITAEGVQRMEAALVTGVPLRLRAKLIGEVTGTVGGPTR